MFNAKKRRIAEVEAHNEFLRTELDTARDKAKQHANRADRFADDRITAARDDAQEMARLQEVAEAWAALAGKDQVRAERLLKAVVRYRGQINDLTARLARWEGDGDRVLMPPPRTGADAVAQLLEARRINALLLEQVRGQADQLAILQKANEAKYWRLARRALAVSDAPPALKAAS